MAEYIEREALMKSEHWETIRDIFDKARAKVIVATFPTAFEVVRCKDCRHCSTNTPDGLHWCDEHEHGCLDDDDFCSYGERRAEE